MWPFKKRETAEDIVDKELESEFDSEEQQKEFFQKMKAEDFKFLQENFPLGTEFVLLGVRFRVYKHLPPPISKFEANYVTGKGEVKYQHFSAEEARTYIEEWCRIEFLNGKHRR